MKILIAQPYHEENIKQLEMELYKNTAIDIALFPEGYLSSREALETACEIARKNNTTIITSFRQNNKDRAVIINNSGQIVLERPKTGSDENETLCDPLAVNTNGITIGYLLCMEILKAVRDLGKIQDKINFIAHPIGVGMFSEEQFNLWINEAKLIAVKYKTMIIGTSHADGSYRNCGISIPISYCIDSNGDELYVSKADTRTRIVNLENKAVEVCSY